MSRTKQINAVASFETSGINNPVTAQRPWRPESSQIHRLWRVRFLPYQKPHIPNNCTGKATLGGDCCISGGFRQVLRLLSEFLKLTVSEGGVKCRRIIWPFNGYASNQESFC